MKVTSAFSMTKDPVSWIGLSSFEGELFQKMGHDAILIDNPSRFVLFPLNYQNIWDRYKRLESHFWTAEDIDFSRDIQNWRSLPEEILELANKSLTYVAILYTIDAHPIEGSLCEEVQIPEARCAFGYQMMQKNVHMEVFSIALSRCSPESETAIRYANEVCESSFLELRKIYISSYITSKEIHYSIKLLALIAAHVIFFKSAQIILTLIGATGCKLDAEPKASDCFAPGLIYGISKINRDQHSFLEFCTQLFAKNLDTRPTDEIAHHVFNAAIKIELELLKTLSSGIKDTQIPNEVLNLLKVLADEALESLGYSALFSVESSISWYKNFLREVLIHNDGDSGLYSDNDFSASKNKLPSELPLDNFTTEEDF